MNQTLPLYPVPKYPSGVAGGSFAIAMAARPNVPKLDVRDLPNPPVRAGHRPS